MKKNTHRYTIKSRFRFSVFVAIIMVLSISCINTAIGLNTAKGSSPERYMEVQVSAGDTLWDISETYLDSMDTREGIYTICQVNDITADQLVDGMILSIPIVDC